MSNPVALTTAKIKLMPWRIIAKKDKSENALVTLISKTTLSILTKLE